MKLIKTAIDYFRDTEVDIRVRLLYLVEYAALVACLVGTIVMLLFTTSIIMLIPNVILLIFCVCGLYISHKSKRYELASNQFIVGCGYISLPIMFFTAGGNKSGMIIWFMFGVIFSCVMSRGKWRIIMPAIMIAISSICMLIGYYRPDWVISLSGERAAFFDAYQSFILVSVLSCATLVAYLYAYDRQSVMLERQKEELRRMMYTDSLTGILNRKAYYDEIAAYKDGPLKANLVVVSLDVNGLKKVNDTQGHSAGDEYIMCAAEIISEAFSTYGNVYRTGGDEFMALLFCNDGEAAGLSKRLQDTISASRNPWTKELSIAIGVGIRNENPDMAFSDLEKLADARMYQDKGEHYKRTGLDRRKAR